MMDFRELSRLPEDPGYWKALEKRIVDELRPLLRDAPMAEAKMREIGETVRARWPGVRALAMWHRVGRLEIGESSVLIAVSAAHRGEAFEACRYAIDTLKTTVPVWKKEHFEDGEVWVGLQGS